MMGADAGFLYAESERQTGTTSVLAVLRPEGRPDAPPRPLTIDDLRAHMEARLDLLPSFRRRVERVPFGLHHPVSVDDPDFDLGYHLRHVTLDDASPDGLARLVSEQASIRLDRRHPLWRFTLVDGLHEGRQGLLLQWHHALADGFACRTILRRLFTDIDINELAAVRAAEPFQPVPVRRGQLAMAGLADLWRSLLLLPLLLWRFAKKRKALEARKAGSDIASPEAAATPITRYNDAWSGKRTVAHDTVPLADILRVKSRAGVTVNDLFLALAAGAVRDDLQATDELPDTALTVNIPVSTEPPAPAGAPARQHGNHFSNYLSSLATDIDDPIERLRQISAVTAEGRAQLDILGPTTLVGLLDNIPPFLAEPGARWLAEDKLEHGEERADYSVILSNVRGAEEQFRFSTASGPVSVERTCVYGMVFDGTGVSLVGWTYGDHVELTAMCDADAVDDPRRLVDGMVRALYELDSALAPSPEGLPAPSKPGIDPEVAELVDPESGPVESGARRRSLFSRDPIARDEPQPESVQPEAATSVSDIAEATDEEVGDASAQR